MLIHIIYPVEPPCWPPYGAPVDHPSSTALSKSIHPVAILCSTALRALQRDSQGVLDVVASVGNAGFGLGIDLEVDCAR